MTYKANIDDRLIKTTHVYPPIPIRSHDWCAYYDGEEETGVFGWGKTEKEAIKALRECEPE